MRERSRALVAAMALLAFQPFGMGTGAQQLDPDPSPVVTAIEFLLERTAVEPVALAYAMEQHELPLATAREVAARLDLPLIHSPDVIECRHDVAGRQRCSLIDGSQAVVLAAVDRAGPTRAVVRIQLLEHLENQVFYHSMTLEMARSEADGAWMVARVLAEEIT